MVENDQSQAMKDLELPDDATNVRAFSVETIFNFYARFGFTSDSGSPNIVSQLDDQDLSFVERVWHPGKISE